MVDGELHVNAKMCRDSSGTGFLRVIHLFGSYEAGCDGNKECERRMRGFRGRKKWKGVW